MKFNLTPSLALKIALFVTGMCGIVAEYILSTLATYFIGDSVFQWTMVLSMMLFSMGLGSRLSRNFNSHLVEIFVATELLLAFFTSHAGTLTYLFMGFIHHIEWVIYPCSIAIGLLIGIEIPIATRINERYEALRTNIAGMMEKDYYGSLLGGVFFAFVGLPYLGLTYTPFALGFLNFAVAVLLWWYLGNLIEMRWKWVFHGSLVTVFAFWLGGVLLAEPIVFWSEQQRYKERVIFSKQTKYQKITITQWKDDYWLFLNASKQLCTFDEWLYHEPLVHPVMHLAPQVQDVLVLGAGDGCAIREILKYPQVRKVVLVDIDPEMTKIGKEHAVFRDLNKDAMHNPKVQIINQDAFTYLERTAELFDVIMADFPDPLSVEVNRLYSAEFYRLCYRQLRSHGAIITQAAGLHFSPLVYRCIDKTMQKVGFHTLPIHNHVYTFGEWTWVIGSKALPKVRMKERLQKVTLKNIPLRWLTPEAMNGLYAFGRDLLEMDSTEIQVNTLQNPILYHYYQEGTWDKYYEDGLGESE
jgi:spermidine synthase